MPNDTPMHTGAGSTPVPDPTLLTTQQLTREIGALREILEAQIDGNQRECQTRFSANERATELLQVIFDRIPDQIKEKVAQLKALQDERFTGVERSFDERDVRVKESATATATAVAAALQAAKEAVGEQNKSFTVSIDKSEKAFGDSISQLRIAVDTATKGLDSQIADIKERLTRIESMGVGRVQAVTETRAVGADTRGNVGLYISVVAIALVLLDFIAKFRPA